MCVKEQMNIVNVSAERMRTAASVTRPHEIDQPAMGVKISMGSGIERRLLKLSPSGKKAPDISILAGRSQEHVSQMVRLKESDLRSR